MPKTPSTRLKLRKFPGQQYDHLSVTLSRVTANGDIEKRHFIVYPASHNINIADKQRERTVESGFRDIDPSDLAPVIVNNAGVISSALSNDVKVLSKEHEQAYCADHPHEKVVVSIPDEKFEMLAELHDDLSSGKYKYSAVDRGGDAHVHCGTVAQTVLERALQGTAYEQAVKRSEMEAAITTHPTSVFQRAETVAKHQQTHKQLDDSSKIPVVDNTPRYFPHAWSMPSFASFGGGFFKPARVPHTPVDGALNAHDASITPRRRSVAPNTAKATEAESSGMANDFAERLMINDCGF